MRTFLALIVSLPLALCSCSTTDAPATKLETANILPLALDDHFEFRKQELSFFDDGPQVNTQSEAINFERARRDWGAITEVDRKQRYGNYYTFYWRTSERADVTVRLEYRQAALGNYVMAQERYYPNAHGSYRSPFAVIGDDFHESGRVTSWRALLIVNGKIVGLTQSYIWK